MSTTDYILGKQDSLWKKAAEQIQQKKDAVAAAQKAGTLPTIGGGGGAAQPVNNPTFTEDQVNAMVGQNNGFTPHESQNNAQETKWMAAVHPDGVTGSPITAANAQVAQLEKNGMVGGDGKRMTAFPSASGVDAANAAGGNGSEGNGLLPRNSAPVTDYQALIDYLDYYKKQIEETEEEKKRTKRNKTLGAISDGISALANMYYSTKGAPVVYEPTTTFTGKMNDRYEQLRKEQQTYRDAYIKAQLQALQEQRAQNQADALNEYRKAQADYYKSAGAEKGAKAVEIPKTEERRRENYEAKTATERSRKENIDSKTDKQEKYGTSSGTPARTSSSESSSTKPKKEKKKTSSSSGRSRARGTGGGTGSTGSGSGGSGGGGGWSRKPY